MGKHQEMLKKWQRDPRYKKEYAALEDEFALFDEMLKARYKAGLTQAEVASRMGTKSSAVARLESSGGAKSHSPSVSTLRKYAEAVGCKLIIKLVKTKRD